MRHSDYWPLGYQEPFEVISIDPLIAALGKIGGETCLEIGCGNGYWTKELLVPKFKNVIAVDIINPIKQTDFVYHQQDNLKGIGSVDAAYSFGVFCHLTLTEQYAYLKQLRSILKGKGLISFANWNRHPLLQGGHIWEVIHGWYYNDIDITDKMLKNAGFEWYDFDPSYRDTIAIIC